MNHLFDGTWESETPEAQEYSAMLRHALEGIITLAVRRNVSLRDLAYVLHSEVSILISTAVLQRNVGRRVRGQSGRLQGDPDMSKGEL